MQQTWRQSIQLPMLGTSIWNPSHEPFHITPVRPTVPCLSFVAITDLCFSVMPPHSLCASPLIYNVLAWSEFPQHPLSTTLGLKLKQVPINLYVHVHWPLQLRNICSHCYNSHIWTSIICLFALKNKILHVLFSE